MASYEKPFLEIVELHPHDIISTNENLTSIPSVPGTEDLSGDDKWPEDEW